MNYNIRTIKRIRKYILLILGIIALLMILLYIFLNTTYGQNKVLPIALNTVSNALNTKVSATKVKVSFFDELTLDDFLALDQHGDTLMYVEQLHSNISLFSFFNKQLSIEDLHLTNPRIYIKRNEDEQYNFDHIIDHLSEDPKTSTADSKAWEILIDHIDLEDLHLLLDQPDSKLTTMISSIKGEFKSFSIPESKFHFEKLIVDGVRASYMNLARTKSETTIATFPGLPISLSADNLIIRGKNINYITSVTKSAIEPDTIIGLRNMDLEVKELYWSDSIHLNLDKFNLAFDDGEEILLSSSNISLSDNSLNIEASSFISQTSDISFDLHSRFPDFNTLTNQFLKTNTSIRFSNSLLSKKDILTYLDNSQFPEIDLQALEDIRIDGELYLDNGKISANNILASISKKLKLEGAIAISNLNTPNSSAAKFNITRLGTSQSYLEQLFTTFEFPKALKDLGYISGSLNGSASPSAINLNQVNISSSKGHNVNGSGKIYDLKNKNGPLFDLNFKQVFVKLEDLFSDELDIPEEIKRLQDIEYAGTLSGNLKDVKADGNLSSTLGNLNLEAAVKFNEDYSNASYNGYFNLQDFDLGYMLNDSLLGITNFEGKISGSGLQLQDLSAEFDGKLSSICYDGYIYENIVIDGVYLDNIFEGKLKSNDPNLKLDLDGRIDLSGSKTSIDVTMNLENIDLRELGFTSENFEIGGVFKGKVNGNSIDDFTGNGTINNFNYSTEKGVYFSDSIISFKAQELNDNAKLFALDAPFLKGEIKGIIQPSTLVRFVKNYIKAYIPLEIGYDEDINENLDLYFAENEDQNFVLSGTTKDINAFLEPLFGKDLKMKKAKLGAYFSSQEARLDIKGSIDSLIYKGVLMQRGSYFFDGRKSFINGNVYLEDITMDNEILIPSTTLNTSLNNKIANFNLVLANENEIERLNVWGDLARTDEYILTFNDSIYLNGSNWHFSPYNQIIFGDYGLFLQDLKLSKDNQAITVYTDENENGEAIEILFDDFNLSELFAIIDKENDFFEGNIDGALLINSVFSKPFVSANLDINDISVAGNPAGALSIQSAQNSQTNVVSNYIILVGPLNNASMTLDYGIDEQTTVGELDIQKLEMAVIDPYLTDVFINSEGFVSGKIKINGDLNNLDLNGTLKTHDVKTTPVFTNSRYIVSDSDIIFSDREIDFGIVKLKDRNNKTAVVEGKIYHKNLRNSVIDLKVSAETFELLNTSPAENELYYGNVFVSGNATVTGPIKDIQIDGTVSAVNNSKLNVSPLSIESETLSDDFIIYSGDPRIIPFDSLQLDLNPTKVSLPFDIDVKVNVSNDSEFTMILNPITGDKLTCNGTSNLILKLNKAGEMKLFGTYTVSSGVYKFSYGLISKAFNIQPGSTVTFNGDPLEGILQVEAVYVANTSVYDLIKLESDLTDAQKSEAQRKRPINVLLKLSDQILKPTITLDITSPEDDLSSISDILNRKLVQLRTEPDELNNQVFGLLLFNNFILARNTDTDLAETGTDLAIGSISGLITAQLNKLADGLMEGFEVNFGINSYSSDYLALGEEGVITELGVGVKQSLFDNRLTISAGTNINLESSSEASNFNTIAGDFVLEYKLNKNGNYIIKAFRKSSYDRLIDENASKTGASFFVRKEFGSVKKKEKKN